jgi:cyclopropane fatty-acyl-phospholipid synthase-like methyltransferase
MKIKKNNNYWNNFYKSFLVRKESSFARFVYKKIKTKKNSKILDVGCGNGRDTFFFLKKGFDVKGIDISETAIINNKKILSKNFFLKDLCSKKCYFNEKFNIIYARFFLHAINTKKEKFFFKNIKKIFYKNTIIFLEFRTIKDPLIKKGEKLSKYERFYTHYRRFIDTKELVKKITGEGFKILHISSSYNYARFNNERPHICRLLIQII